MPNILDENYRVVENVMVAPICGEDFCDGCGDCLVCYGGDWCPEGSHTWVVYAEDAAAFKARHGL